MKPIHTRLYTVLPRPPVASSSVAPLPRVRSNSASRSLYTANHLSFFDAAASPPPPNRGNSNVIVSTRLAAEVRAEIEGHTNHPSQHQSGPLPYSLALTLGQTDSSSHLPLSPNGPFFGYSSLSPLFAYSAKSAEAHENTEHRKKRQRTRYHLDVGAYGIPKRSGGACVAGRDGHGRFDVRAEPQSEKLGRAVQVGEDAYFVRDNAMGVADGVGGWSRLRRTDPAHPSASALFARGLMHYCSEEVDAATPSDLEQCFADMDLSSEAEDLREQLEDSLEDLEDGLDVLMILEKAYQKTMQSHVRPAPPAQTTNLAPETPSLPTPSTGAPPAVVPLCEGSSTALVAILEPAPPRPRPSGTLLNPQPIAGPEETAEGAVIRIAHLGDCVGMLIRGEEIVWRTEEMWWNFNTPVQLGPASATRPQDARVFTVPVQADDVLILASDGLSDNLWDKDILDEVVRFRHSFMGDGLASDAPATHFRRTTLAGMLSEALCSRAKRVSETRSSSTRRRASLAAVEVEVEVPFAKRAREQGKLFQGGKPDDISVLVAVISPAEAR